MKRLVCVLMSPYFLYDLIGTVLGSLLPLHVRIFSHIRGVAHARPQLEGQTLHTVLRILHRPFYSMHILNVIG